MAPHSKETPATKSQTNNHPADGQAPPAKQTVIDIGEYRCTPAEGRSSISEKTETRPQQPALTRVQRCRWYGRCFLQARRVRVTLVLTREETRDSLALAARGPPREVSWVCNSCRAAGRCFCAAVRPPLALEHRGIVPPKAPASCRGLPRCASAIESGFAPSQKRHRCAVPGVRPRTRRGLLAEPLWAGMSEPATSCRCNEKRSASVPPSRAKVKERNGSDRPRVLCSLAASCRSRAARDR